MPVSLTLPDGEEFVANVENRGIATVHRDQMDAIARCKVEIANGPLHITRRRADNGFDHHHVAPAQGGQVMGFVAAPVQADQVGTVQRHHVVTAAMHHQPVANVQARVGGGR